MSYRVYVKGVTKEEIESTFDYGYGDVTWNEKEHAWQVDGPYSGLYAWLCAAEDDAPGCLPHAEFSELFEVGVDEPQKIDYGTNKEW